MPLGVALGYSSEERTYKQIVNLFYPDSSIPYLADVSKRFT